jgi:hypothetical protein
MVNFSVLRPVACRNLNDAIEASKFNTWQRSHDFAPKSDFVRQHQVGSRMDGYVRIPTERDCVVASNDSGLENYPLESAVEIKRNAPNLPPGMIAICAVGYGFRMGPGELPTPDCTGTADPSKPPYKATGYWIVAEPNAFMRNFDLPREDQTPNDP